MSTDDQNSKSVIIVIIITTIGVLGGALFTNWDKVFKNSFSATSGNSSTSTSSEQISSIKFKIYDRLYQETGQINASTTILIDGKNVGTVSIDTSQAESTLEVTLPKSGKYSYTLYTTATQNYNGSPIMLTGNGQGMIDVNNGDFFFLRGGMSGNTWIISLEKQ